MAKTILRILAAGLFLLFAIPVGCISYVQYMPHLLLNDTTKRLYHYREVRRSDGAVSLVPDFFLGGENKLDVEQELLSAGLKSWNNSYQKLPERAASMQAFLFAAGGRDLVCGNELFLLIAYDSREKLQSATIRQGGACL